MASVPGLEADVYYGDAEKALPDWRENVADSDEDGEEPEEGDTLSDEEHQAVTSILGFDPLEDGEEESE